MEVGGREADADGLALGRKRLAGGQERVDALAVDIEAESGRAAEIGARNDGSRDGARSRIESSAGLASNDPHRLGPKARPAALAAMAGDEIRRQDVGRADEIGDEARNRLLVDL